jgi:hypothetical protein
VRFLHPQLDGASFPVFHLRLEQGLEIIQHLAMRSSPGVGLRDVEKECRRSIDIVVKVVKQNELRKVSEIVRLKPNDFGSATGHSLTSQDC